MTTPAEPDPIAAAAAWLASGGADRSNPIVPQLRERFLLSAKEACHAVRESNLIKARAH